MAIRNVSSAVALATVLLGGVGICAPHATAAPFITAPFITAPGAPAAPIPGMDRYVDPANGWSISYPTGWRVDGADPALVQIRDPENQALVRIQVMPTGVSLNAAADQMLASQEQYLTASGLTWALSSRQLISLPNGTAAVDVKGDLLPGGRSHQLYLIKAGRVFAVNAETSAALWDKFNGDFDRIMASFALPA